jgi:Replication-relaxation
VLSENQFSILLFLALHYTLTASQIRRLLFGADKDRDGRQTRRLLASLLPRKLINQTKMRVVNPLHAITAGVYYPSREGKEYLAVKTGDTKWLLTPTQTPQWTNLYHWVGLSDLRIAVFEALKQQSAVEIPEWFNEFDVVNRQAEKPQDRYRLYTVCEEQPRKIVCVPDAAFLLRKTTGAAKAYYVELETGSNPVQKAANEKTPGYAKLAEKGLHTRHFPGVGGFSVLCFAPDPQWRDFLRKCFRPKERVDLWKFAALTDVKPATFFEAPIFYTADDGPPSALVKGAAGSPGQVTGQVSGVGREVAK